MSGTGLKVCVRGGGGWVWCLKPIIVFSLARAGKQFVCTDNHHDNIYHDNYPLLYNIDL